MIRDSDFEGLKLTKALRLAFFAFWLGTSIDYLVSRYFQTIYYGVVNPLQLFLAWFGDLLVIPLWSLGCLLILTAAVSLLSDRGIRKNGVAKIALVALGSLALVSAYKSMDYIWIGNLAWTPVFLVLSLGAILGVRALTRKILSSKRNN
jgi:hypothetical protein